MRYSLLSFLVLLAPLPAAAEIIFSGEAKMGLVFDGKDMKAKSGVRLTAHAYGVTDGGLEYGAVLDLDTAQNPAFPNTSVFRNDRPRGYVYISGGNHTLKMGTGVNGAARSVIGDLPTVGP